MSPKFSIIYPTRNRPAFINAALYFLREQNYSNFEVIVCDNSSSQNLSCEEICKNYPLIDIKYLKQEVPVGMVENWNYGLSYATGDYIIYLSDKMFLLPHTLEFAANAAELTGADILSWVSNDYYPNDYPNYFGCGRYKLAKQSPQIDGEFRYYNPSDELKRRTNASMSRSEDNPSDYARGKINFGAYSRPLIERILNQTGALFYNIAPDYTSMVFGLSWANSAIELSRSGIIHLHTDLSNGGQCIVSDVAALRFLDELKADESLFNNMLIPGLYCSQHNLVTHDYLSLKRKFDLPFELNRLNWLTYIAEDLNLPRRQWSSVDVKLHQKKLFDKFIQTQLGAADVDKLQKNIATRAKSKSNRKSNLIHLLKKAAPNGLVNIYKFLKKRNDSVIHLPSVHSVLELEKTINLNR